MMKQTDIDDPIKSELLMKTTRHREELEEETRAIAERTEKIITHAVVIGGALALTYFLYTQLSGSKKKKAKSKKSAVAEVDEEVEETSAAGSILSQVGTALVSQGGVLLLALAKEKLTEYLRAQADKNKE
ncbi:MAG TPA: hypothetical protein VFM90_09780 [Cyclobacteriaceae bacterium]|nr:hypothetical protein [Cyclobacteriaceae bacterium]